MDTPHGPHKVSGNRQVAIPKAVADRLGIKTGSKVFFVVSDDEPEIVTVVPERLMSAWTRAGRRGSKPAKTAPRARRRTT